MIYRNGIYSEYKSRDGVPEASCQLEDDGFTLMKQVLSADEVAALSAEINQIFDDHPPAGRSDKRSEAEDQAFRYEMFNIGAVCQETIGHRGILDVVEPLLGSDCHVIANTAWRNVPTTDWQHGGGGWHIDAGPHIPLPEGVIWPENIPHPVFAIGVHIYLRDCTLADGPTGVIPGSHLSGQFPPIDQYLNDDLTYNDQGVVPLIAEAGDVALFVSDVWHRRMRTMEGDAGRFFLQVHYGRRDIAQRIKTTAEVNHLSADALHRAQSERDKSLIGIHPALFYDG